MILVDTSIWIDHIRSPDEQLARLLANDRVLVHPYVIGELAIGNLNDRDTILRDLGSLREAVVARPEEVLSFIARHALFGTGIGYVDVHLLASVTLTPGAALWSRDKRLIAAEAKVKASSTKSN